VISTPLLYTYGFDKYNITDSTPKRIERDELLSAGRQIRDYFNDDEEFLIIRVIVGGIRVRSLFNSREVLHMRDVKSLVRGVYRVQEVTAVYLALFAAVGLAAWRRRFLPHLERVVMLGGLATLGLVGLAGVGALVGFDRLFLAFHLVSFSNDLWQLDPRTDYLIAMFPERFFFDATMWIAGSTVLGGLVLTAVPLALRWRRGRKARREAAQSPVAGTREATR
jgi:integral membrane protein (TIGR01906 family)